MTGLLFILALAALPLLGLPLARRFLAMPNAAATIGTAGALGALLLCAEMFLLSVVGIRWSVALLLAPFAVLAVVWRPNARRPPAAPAAEPLPWPAIGAASLAWLAAAYAAATARATSSDLLLFWGAKGERFAAARGIDVAFLRDPMHLLMHTDYPPMLTLLDAWAALVAGRFAWGAAMLSMPLFLGLSLLTFYGFARPSLGRRSAAEHTALLAALLGFVFVETLTAGNADPLLVYFEVLSLSAIVFAGDRAGGLAAAAVGLTGAVLTKVEGTPFAAIVILGFVLFGPGGRRWRAAAVLGLPCLAALASWIAFGRAHGLLDVYRLRDHAALRLESGPAILRTIVQEGAYGAAFAPWIVVAVLIGLGSRSRDLGLLLATAAGFLAFMVYMYATLPADPTLWIRWSAARLLLTPLLCLALAAAAGARPAPPTLRAGTAPS